MGSAGSCWLLGAFALVSAWTLVSSRCGGSSARDVQKSWRKLTDVMTVQGRLDFMEAVFERLAHPEFETDGKHASVDKQATTMRIFNEVSTLVNLLDRRRVLWHQMRHLMTRGEDLGGVRTLLLPDLLRAMDPVLTKVSGDFSGPTLNQWRDCIQDIEDMVTETFETVIGDEHTSAAICEIKAGTGDPSKPIKGRVFFAQAEHGPTKIKISLDGFGADNKNTKHGFHVHAEGSTGNACKDAGSHFNPDNKEHGGPTDEERHVGDLGNVVVDAQGRVDATLSDVVATLRGPHSVMGKSIVVHAGEDDLGRGGFPDSKTTGHAGARLGCCVIKPFTLTSSSHAKKPSHWSYHGSHGPSHWADEYKACGGVRQSPVDISTKSVLKGGAEAFKLSEAYSTGHVMELVNNGHAAKVSLAGDYVLSGGTLPGSFKAAQFHFHWGGNNDQGSEHTLDTKPFPLEMHIVHVNSKYTQIADALKDTEGLAVLGVFFKQQEEDNPALNPIIEHLHAVKEPGSVVTLKSVALSSLLSANLGDYYRYYGSLTTPPCSEAVVWTLFSQPVGISSKQLEGFRSLLTAEGDHLVDNFRPVQPLNARQVFHRGSA